jgi:hypothetical protein
MSKVAIATELERHKHTKMPGMKEVITDKVVETLKAPAKEAVKEVKAVKAPKAPKAVKAPKAKEVKAPKAKEAAVVRTKFIKGSQEAKDYMASIRNKKKTA